MPENRDQDREPHTGPQRTHSRPNDPVTAIRYRRCGAAILAVGFSLTAFVLFSISEGAAGPMFNSGLCAILCALGAGVTVLALDGQAWTIDLVLQQNKRIDALDRRFAKAEKSMNNRLDDVVEAELENARTISAVHGTSIQDLHRNRGG